MYKINSDFATEFICDTEILESLDYAKKNKNNLGSIHIRNKSKIKARDIAEIKIESSLS